MEGETINESVVHGEEQWVNWNSQSISVSRMAMASDSTNNSMRSSAMSDVFIALFTFLVHVWLVICKSDPRWLFAKWSSFALLSCACSNFASPTPNFCLIRAVCSNDQWIKVCAGPHPQFRCPIDDDSQWYLALPIPDSRLKCYVAGSRPYSMVEKFHKSNKTSKFNAQNFLHTLFLTWKFPDYMMYMYTTFWYLCIHVCVLKFTHVW